MLQAISSRVVLLCLIAFAIVSCSAEAPPDVGEATGTHQEALSMPTEVAPGGSHTCVALFDGTVWCWGRNQFGQLGDGTTTQRFAPVQVIGITNAKSVTAGDDHTCALRADSTVVCWGANYAGQLGLGTSDSSPHTTPVTVPGVMFVWNISSGMAETCVRTFNSTVLCWGDDFWGQTGRGIRGGITGPIEVPGVSNVSVVSVGRGHVCAARYDGLVLCWGNNQRGELGNGTVADTVHAAAVVPGVSNAFNVTTKGTHTCATLNDMKTYCWGSNSNGQLNDPATIGTSRGTAQLAPGLVYTPTIATTADSSCGVRGDGRFTCAGLVPEPATATARNLPCVTGFGVGTMRGGLAHICAVMNDGSIQCLGDNSYGQLGDGTTTRRNAPVVVTGFGATNLDDWKCCVAHQSTASLGCGATPVQQCVCDQRPSCCTTNWDATCASLATNSNCWNPGLCGNGVKEPGEDCDDGNVNPGDGCGPMCLSEASACVPRFTPGVSDRNIRQCVCFGAVNDPFCCNNSWDSICVNEAINSCGAQCGSPCTPHSTPGSSNPNTTQCVCNAPVNDPFCCNFNWDSICVAEAQSSCGLICID